MRPSGPGIAACLPTLLAAVLAARQPPPLPLSALPLRLTGLMVDDTDARNSACFIRCNSGEERHGGLKVGDVACDVAEVREIRADGVVLRNLSGNRLELLVFPGGARPAAAEPAPPPPAGERPAGTPATPAGAIDVELPKASVEHYLANLNELLESALAVPHYREAANGRKTIDGFEVSRIKDGGAAQQLGLQNGDVILEVDGQPLDSMAAVMTLFGQLPSMAHADVTILRNGQRKTFAVTVK